MAKHVYPVKEEAMHILDGEDALQGVCDCDPIVEWIDDETGLPYEDGPLVIHHCFTDEAYAACKVDLERIGAKFDDLP